MKKLISLILIVILALSSLTVSTSAETLETADTSDLDGIIAAMNAVESVREQMGLLGIDFYELTYSDSINVYDYTKDGLVFNCEFIPIKYEKDLVGWVIKKAVDGEVYYQFTAAFAEKVNQLADDMEFAIIYGYDANYLYDGKEIYTLGNVSMPVEGRAVLESAEQLEGEKAVLQSISSSYGLSYSNPDLNARLPVYFSCDVEYVSQPKKSKLCWADSAACIVNYLKNMDIRATAVAIKWCGTMKYDEYNCYLEVGLEDDVLKMYEVSYTYKKQMPSSNILLVNIKGGYPVLGTFLNKATYIAHDVVIYGTNIMSSYLYYGPGIWL